MTAVTVDNTGLLEVWNMGQIIPIPLTASTKIPGGVMVMVISGTGTAQNAADTANGVVMGVSTQLVDTALGHTVCPVRRGRFWFKNDGTVTAANIGQIATVLDNVTVSIAATTTNDIPAGQILAVDTIKGVCIDMAGGKIGT